MDNIIGLKEAGMTGVHAETRLREKAFVMPGNHCHNCFELFYVQTGSCRFLVTDKIYDLRAGDFIMIPPLVLHYTRYLFGPCRRTVILFDRDCADEKVTSYLPGKEDFFSNTQVFQVPEVYQKQVIEMIRYLTTEGQTADGRSQPVMRLLLQILLIQCTRVCVFLQDSPVRIHTTDPQILKAARFIGDHYMDPISVRDIADAAGFSPNYLSRKFRETAGIGLHEYLVFIRLDHARLELISTRDSITSIALRCGFSDSNYFKDAFKKKYGMTPRNYRKAAGYP